MKDKLIFISMLCSVCACNNDIPEAPDTLSREPGMALELCYDVADEEWPTRAVLEHTYLDEGSKVGIYAIKESYNQQTGVFTVDGITNPDLLWAETNIQKNLKNARFKAVDIYNAIDDKTIHTLQSDESKPGGFPAGNQGALKLFGYYPYFANIHYSYDGTENRVPAPKIDIEINDNATLTEDYLYMIPKDVWSGTLGRTPVVFKHALSLLKISVKTTEAADFDMSYAPILKKVIVETRYSQTGQTMNIATGEISENSIPDGRNKFEIPFPQGLPLINTSAQELGKLLLIPRSDGDVVSKITFVVIPPDQIQEKEVEVYNRRKEPDNRNRLNLQQGTVTNFIVTYTKED